MNLADWLTGRIPLPAEAPDMLPPGLRGGRAGISRAVSDRLPQPPPREGRGRMRDR